MNRFRSSEYLAAGFLLAVLAGCGGGGGGGDGGGTTAVVYSGNSSAAGVSTTNASTITANVAGGSDAGSIIAGVSVESSSSEQTQGSGPAWLSRYLGERSRNIVTSVGASGSRQTLAGADITGDCDSGSIQVSGNPNPDGTGIFSVRFFSCTFDGITIDGPATLRVDATTFTPPTFVDDFTFTFPGLTLRGVGLSIDAGGSIRFQDSGGVSRATLNLDERNNNTGKMRKTVNLDILTVVLSPTTFNQTLTGQVYHSDFGYVDVTTTTPFFFGSLAQLFPDSGEMLLTGDANRTIRVTAVNSTLVQLQLDLDGDSIVDNTARLKWTELDGPVGADLGDNDGDGMHNSWETFYGLNPNDAADATAHNDGDGFDNLAEYMAGTNPNDTASHP